MANLSSPLNQAADDHPGRLAVRMDGLVLTYAELRDAAGRVTSLLTSLGIAPGDRIAIMLPNVPAFPILFYGALGADAVVVPMNPLLKSREVAYYLGDSGAKVLFAWHTRPARRPRAPRRRAPGRRGRRARPRRPAGRPAPAPPARAVQRRRRRDPLHVRDNWPAQGRRAHPREPEPQRRAHRCHPAKASPDDVVMGCLPLFHIFGLTCGLNATIVGGATLTLLPRFDPGRALEIIGRDKVTIFEGVPTMYAAMLHHPASAGADVTSLRTCISGGASMPVEVMHGFEETFGCMILEGYGLSETSPVASFNLPSQVRKPGTIGTPVEGVEMRVVDTDGRELPTGEAGEIEIRGHNIMKGYWGQPGGHRRSDPRGLVPDRRPGHGG